MQECISLVHRPWPGGSRYPRSIVNPRATVRSNMVNGAVRLLATAGVEGTSFREVLELSDAPRGSVYHHFPGGKSELLHEALNRTSELSLALLEPVRGQPVETVLERF